MALTKCKECGGLVSKSAPACPRCGAKRHVGACGCLAAILILPLLIIMVIIILRGLDEHDSKRSSRRNSSNNSGVVTSDQSINWSGGEVSIPIPPHVPLELGPWRPLPKYRVLEEIPYDSPIKTQIEYRVTLDETANADELRRLLDHLLDLGTNRQGFKNHGGKSSHIYAYVYPTEKHTGMNWIGMVSKIGRNAAPKFEIKNDLLNTIPSQEPIFGKSLEQRKAIFREILIIENVARQQALDVYPLPDPKSPRYNSEAAKSIFMKQVEEENNISTKLQESLLKRYDITKTDFNGIAVEGVKSNWPRTQ